MVQPAKYENLVGRQFGRLTVVAHGRTVTSKRGTRTYWLCRCRCGAEKQVRSDGLKSGDNVSCGCKKVEQLTEHSGTGTVEHKTWCSMIERCHPQTGVGLPRYGGRGIQVCERWRSSFQLFLDDVGPRPTGQHSIDRIDNDGNYEPGNVRWATKKQQARNRNLTKLSEEKAALIRSLAGKKTQREIAKIIGVSASNVSRVVSLKAWA